MEMVLTNQNGDVSSRRLRMNTLENKNPEDGDWNLIVFDELAISRAQHYLLMRISLIQMTNGFFASFKESKENFLNKQIGTFMGSEFAFED